MYYKLSLKNILKISIIIILTILNISCTTLNIWPDFSDEVNQGIYLKENKIKKLKIGMTKPEIIENIGSPTFTDIFGSNTWYYVYHNDNKKIIQKTLILKFNQHNSLIYINNHE